MGVDVADSPNGLCALVSFCRDYEIIVKHSEDRFSYAVQSGGQTEWLREYDGAHPTVESMRRILQRGWQLSFEMALSQSCEAMLEDTCIMRRFKCHELDLRIGRESKPGLKSMDYLWAYSALEVDGKRLCQDSWFRLFVSEPERRTSSVSLVFSSSLMEKLFSQKPITYGNVTISFPGRRHVRLSLSSGSLAQRISELLDVWLRLQCLILMVWQIERRSGFELCHVNVRKMGVSFRMHDVRLNVPCILVSISRPRMCST